MKPINLSTSVPAILKTPTKYAACGLLLMSMAFVTGCLADGQTPVDALIHTISPETPGQVARDAFNVYDADVRRKSVNTFAAAAFGGQPPYLRMYRLLIDDPDPTVRAACCMALGIHGQVEDAKLLAAQTHDEATIVRWEAAKALQKIHDPAVIDSLTNLLGQDKDQDVRQAAAIALGQYPTLAVFNQLVGALDDRSYSVVDAAHHSLKLLTGYDFGVDGSLWLTFARKDSKAVFVHQEQYYWQPYEQSEKFVDKAQFWKAAPKPLPPRIPTGLTPIKKAQQPSQVQQTP